MNLSEKDKLAVEISKDFYYEGKSQAQIAKERSMHPSKVSRILKYALEVGIVKIEINHKNGPTFKRQKDPEDELVKNFSLKNAIVIELPPATESAVGTVGAKKRDDELHKCLGKATASHLKTILRDEDHVATGGGRAMYNTAIELFALGSPPNPSLNQENITVTSLNGNSDTRIRARNSPDRYAHMPLDSDVVVIDMAPAFKSGATPNRMCLPLVGDPDQIKDFKKKRARLLSSDYWEQNQQKVPKIVIFGVGAFLGAHRFNMEPKGPILSHIKSHLSSLKKDSDELRKICGYIPVGDVCNRLFFIPPPNGEEKLTSTTRELVKKIEGEIEEINDHLLTIEFKQLEMVNTVIAVAGGKNKRHALFHLLTDFEPNGIVDVLVTDKDTAEYLIHRISMGNSFRPN